MAAPTPAHFDALLPCPICGPTDIGGRPPSPHIEHAYFEQDGRVYDGWVVRCTFYSHSSLQGPIMSTDIEGAVTAWNKWVARKLDQKKTHRHPRTGREVLMQGTVDGFDIGGAAV